MLALAKIGGGLKRVNHAAVAVGEMIYAFGGFEGSEDYSRERPIDVYTLDMSTLRWQHLQYSDGGNPANVPFKRYGHSVVAAGDIIYLWGGRRDEVACNKMFMFDTNTLSWLDTQVRGDIPAARDGHAACLFNGNMFIFGGFEDATKELSDTVYLFNLKLSMWFYSFITPSDLIKKDFMSCVAMNNKIYLFGGRSYSCPFYENDIVELDLSTRILSKLEIEGYKPIGRRSHSAVVVNDKMLIFGGYNDIYDEHYSDFAIFDPEELKWKNVTVTGANPPTARRRHCCVAVNSYLYIFGGSCPMPGASGAQAHLLTDLDDLCVLDTKKSLRSMALQVILDKNLPTRGLTLALAREVENYRTANSLVCTSCHEVLDLTVRSARSQR